MNLQYSTVFSLFLGRVNDVEYLKIDEDYLKETWLEWLKQAVARPYIRKLFSSISMDDVMEEINFTLRNSVDEMSDIGFVSEVLAQSLVIAWLEPQVKNRELTAYMIAGKEEKMFSASSHLKELQTLLSETKLELRKMIRDYGYINNSYIGGA